MIFQEWVVVAVVILMGTSLSLLISYNWRYYVIGLVIQYMAVFWLVAMVWPLGLAAVKLVVGWMTAALLGAAHQNSPTGDEMHRHLSETLLRVFSALMVWVVVFSGGQRLVSWIPANPSILLGGAVLVGMGILQLGMTTRPLAGMVGLLTTLSGFEVLYAVMESSVLVTGLLAIINLGVALAGAYLAAFYPAEEAR